MKRALVAVCCAMLSTSASAAIVTVTYTGTVVNSLDGSDTPEFGLTGADVYNGMIAKAVFVIDTATPGATVTDTAEVLRLQGGASGSGIASPVLSASFTVNGTTKTLASTPAFAIEGLYENTHTSDLNQITVGAGKNVDSNSSFLQHSIGAQYTSGMNSTFGSLSYYIYGYGYDEFVRSSVVNANFSSVSVSEVSSVPEPATWAILFIGFTLIGVKAYYRRLDHCPRTVGGRATPLSRDLFHRTDLSPHRPRLSIASLRAALGPGHGDR